ncbi:MULTISPECIES: amidase [Ramlibacter]|uniref:Amidase n=1 Tax=Ramlibacter pinisoli TaxID=2682844 RepID=A0A6N8IM38_9BURK|nr:MULTISPECIES: amidase [Ramlibacter]MBA2960556.1 amidase [Ramlibacter sp. CGMCC 1.13660]MVQ27887.1 amidase [Ramlibacter pinisoli]
MTPLRYCSAVDLQAAYACGATTPAAVLEEALRAADEGMVGAVLVGSDRAAARQAAQASGRRWRDGRPLSPLDGVPFTIKDNIPVAGLPCTWGSALYRGYVPAADELPVARLRAAGAVVVGKTNCPEFTLHGYTANALFGVTGNPWNPALTPGGSSGGAVAAVALGIGPLALGTDGGGSLRRPAGYTGVVALKPTVGRVERRDGLAALLGEFEVIGPIARSVADLQLAMPLLAPDFAPRASVPRLRILRIRAIGGGPVAAVIQSAMDTVVARLQALGHTVDEQDDLPLADLLNREVWPVVSAAGLAWVLRAHPGWRDHVGAALRPLAETGEQLAAADLVQAFDHLRSCREQLHDLQRDWDVILTPTAAAMPWPADQPHPPTIDGHPVGPRGHAVFTAWVNGTGVPALALPAPRAPDGLPIGFQLVGRHGADDLLCALGAQYEAAHPWGREGPAAAPTASAN